MSNDVKAKKCTTIERKKAVMDKLHENGSANIIELADKLGVSSMTIRRDLMQFAKEGLVRLEYGGAVLNDGSLFEYNMAMKKGQNQKEKQAIARKSLEFIKDGGSIFLDAGTTVNEIAKLLINRRNLNVITNSLLVANTLSKAAHIRLLMCPGVFRETSMAFMGQMTDSFVDQFSIDVLFLGVEGVGLDKGLTVPDITDGSTKRHLTEKAKKVVCLADSVKFSKSFFYQICDFDSVDALITDANLEHPLEEKYLAEGIPLIRAEDK